MLPLDNTGMFKCELVTLVSLQNREKLAVVGATHII